MTDARTGCPERVLIPPEPDAQDDLWWEDYLYQQFIDGRYESEYLQSYVRAAERAR